MLSPWELVWMIRTCPAAVDPTHNSTATAARLRGTNADVLIAPEYNSTRRSPVRFRRAQLVSATAALALCTAALGAQKPPDRLRQGSGESRRSEAEAGGDWPMYARDLAGTKFSPLRQINADNVSKL